MPWHGTSNEYPILDTSLHSEIKKFQYFLSDKKSALSGAMPDLKLLTFFFIIIILFVLMHNKQESETRYCYFSHVTGVPDTA